MKGRSKTTDVKRLDAEPVVAFPINWFLYINYSVIDLNLLNTMIHMVKSIYLQLISLYATVMKVLLIEVSCRYKLW